MKGLKPMTCKGVLKELEGKPGREYDFTEILHVT